jgi:hypothetical protein
VLVDNGAFELVCRLGRRFPAAIPALNRFAAGAATRRERVDRSHRVFASPRLVRFTEMEYAIPRARAEEAVRAVKEILERHPVSFPLELRFAAADDALLSPAFERDSAYVAVHAFAGMPWEAPFREVEALLSGWGGRPHWGKRSFLGAAELAPRLPGLGRVAGRAGRSSTPTACSRTGGRSGCSGRCVRPRWQRRREARRCRSRHRTGRTCVRESRAAVGRNRTVATPPRGRRHAPHRNARPSPR